eukprot:4449860-Prymnesium_polylepis.1
MESILQRLDTMERVLGSNRGKDAPIDVEVSCRNTPRCSRRCSSALAALPSPGMHSCVDARAVDLSPNHMQYIPNVPLPQARLAQESSVSDRSCTVAYKRSKITFRRVFVPQSKCA